MATMLDQLSRTPLCRGLERVELSRLVEAGRIEVWPKGSVIMEEGSSGPRLVILLEGNVTIHKRDANNRGQLIAELGPGAVLGEMSLLRDAPRSASVHAKTTLRLFAIDRRNFEEMARDGDPAALKIGLAIAKVLARRVEELNRRVMALLEANQTTAPLVDQYDEISGDVLNSWEFTESN